MNCNFQVDGYEIDYEKILGKGAYGIVFECKSLQTKEELCVKMIEVYDQQSAKREESILNCLSSQAYLNPYVVKVKKVVYQEKKRIMGVVMEKCQTNLQQVWEKKKIFSSEEIRIFLKQLISGYEILHKNHIIHRDIKPENILINYVNNAPTYKLADFGVGKIYEGNDQNLTKAKGTPAYAPPEINSIIYRQFDNIDEDLETDSASCQNDQSPVDIYSIGIILHQLVFGRLPFSNSVASIRLFFDQLKNNQFKLQCEDQDKELVQLIQEMIVYKPSQRISFQELKKRFPIIQIISYQKKTSQQGFTQSTDTSQDQKAKPIIMPDLSKKFNKQNSFAFPIQGQQNNGQLLSPRYQGLPQQQFKFELQSPRSVQNQGLLQEQEQQMLQELKESLEFLQQSSICLNDLALSEVQTCIQKLNSSDLKKFLISLYLSDLKKYFSYDPSKNYTNNYIRFLFLFAYFAYAKDYKESIIGLKVEEQKNYLDQWKQKTLRSQ